MGRTVRRRGMPSTDEPPVKRRRGAPRKYATPEAAYAAKIESNRRSRERAKARRVHVTGDEATALLADPERVNGLLEAAQQQDLVMADRFGLNSCIECGICTYVCPSRLPLMGAIRGMKAER